MADNMPIAWPRGPSNAEPPDPLLGIKMIHGLAGVQGQINQNQKFQRDFAARDAVGKAFGGAVGEDGNVDYNALETALARDPAAAPMLPEIMSQIEARKKTQLDAAKVRLDMGLTQVDQINRALGALTMKGDTVTYDDVVEQVSKVVANLAQAGQKEGWADPKYVAKHLAMLPKDGPGLLKKLQLAQLQNLEMKDQLAAVYGQIDAVSMGGRTDMIRKSPFMGQTELMGSGGHAASPESMNELAEREARPNERLPDGTIAKGGESIKQPRSSFAPMSSGGAYRPAGGRGPQAGGLVDALAGGAPAGIPPVAGMTGAPAAVAGTPMAAMPGAGDTGPMSGARGGPENPPIGDPTRAGGMPLEPRPSGRPGAGGAVVSGQGAAQTAKQQKEGMEAGEATGALNSSVMAGQSLLTRMGEMRNLMKEIRLGGGSSFYQTLARGAQALNAPTKLVDAINQGDLGAAQEFEKFALKGAVEDLRQMLVGSRMTNLEFENFIKANPNIDLDPRAVEKIFNFATKVHKINTAKQDFQAKFDAANGDPRLFETSWEKEGIKRGFWTLREVENAYKGAPTGGEAKAGRRSPEEIMRQYFPQAGAK